MIVQDRVYWQGYAPMGRSHAEGRSPGNQGFVARKGGKPDYRNRYKSHFFDELNLIFAVSAVAYGSAWLDQVRSRPNGKSMSANPVSYRSFER